jgi:hypothetical protein
MTTFKKISDVTGFNQCRGPVDDYRGFKLTRVDVSGASSFGYDYALMAKAPSGMPDEIWLSPAVSRLLARRFAKSATLSLTDEPNKLGRPGSFSTGWFRDADVDRASRDFRRAVDSAISAVESA